MRGGSVESSKRWESREYSKRWESRVVRGGSEESRMGVVCEPLVNRLAGALQVT